MTAETFDAVLADVEEIAQYAAIYYPEADDALHDRIMKAKGRLAAAHAAEVETLRDGRLRFSARIIAAESRAEAATALLRECLQFVPDDLAARVAEMVGRE